MRSMISDMAVVLVNSYLKWEFAHISRHTGTLFCLQLCHRKSLTDLLLALVPDPADGQGNGKDFDFHCSSRHRTEKDIN